MEIRIGIKNVSRELSVEVSEDAEAVAKTVSQALAKAEEPGACLELTSSKGKRVIVPVSSLGFVEFGGEEARPVGFGTL